MPSARFSPGKVNFRGKPKNGDHVIPAFYRTSCYMRPRSKGVPVYLFFRKIDFAKNQQTTKQHEKFPRGQRVHFYQKIEGCHDILSHLFWCCHVCKCIWMPEEIKRIILIMEERLKILNIQNSNL